MSLSRGNALAALSLGALLLAGCADPELGALDRELSAIRSDPGPVQRVALPEIPDYEALSYEAGDRRSPFVARLPESEAEAPEGSEELAPDMTRPREPLEAYGLERLALVGTLMMHDGQPSALVRAPDGQVHRLRIGNYLGTDFGRIVAITTHSVQLLEVVPTGRGGWIERTTVLTLNN